MSAADDESDKMMSELWRRYTLLMAYAEREDTRER